MNPLPIFNDKRNLDEVSFIRPILIILLILVHCFTVFNGGWAPFEGYNDCSTYKWLSRFCYSFLLETFVFISGYVWAYQVLDLRKQTTLRLLIKNKIERLIVPSIIFSILYWGLYSNENITSIMGGGRILLSVLSGVGHLWYLPTLFWCFISMWIIEKIKISDRTKLIVLSFFALLPYPYIPFQIGRVPYYLLFFFAGYKTWQHGESFRCSITTTRMLVSWLLFLVIFIVLRLFTAHIIEMSEVAPLFVKVAFKITITFCKVF